MRLLADLNIARRTVAFLRSLGHDVVRVDEVLAPTAEDAAIVTLARQDQRTVLTQDLDFSAIVALSGRRGHGGAAWPATGGRSAGAPPACPDQYTCTSST